MAIANSKDLTHIVRTTQQWTSSYDAYENIPEGVLCIEFTPSGEAKAKIGNGREIFSKLPYIGGAELTNYYTKQETVNCVQDILKTQKVIRIKGILNDKSQLPSNATCGDLYFVISQNQSSSNKYDEYVYSPNNTWETLGSIPIDIDLSEYAKIVYVDQKIEEVNDRIDDIEQHGTHTHANKDILDLITAAFTAEEKDKLSTLYNYDDTELRELITQASHTHSNKEILDAISAPFTREDKSKLDQLNPYDDSVLKEKIQALERLAHEHSNKRILDRTTASFTTEYERKMRWIRIYTGCTGMEEGIAGLVPAAQAGEEDYVLSGSGEWVPQTGGGGTYTLPIATASTLGGIKVGDGLEINENGVLSVTGGGGGDSIAEGDGITITTDPQTGVKTISVNSGDGLDVNQDGELEINTGNGLQIDEDGKLAIDESILPEVPTLEAGVAISIEDVEQGGATYDAWNNGTGWENVCYSAAVGDSVTGNYQWEAHSPISNSYEIPVGATKIRAVAYDNNDALLWVSYSWLDSNDHHYASLSPEDGHYDEWYDIPSDAVKVNFGVRHSKLDVSQAMNLNDIKSVDITCQIDNPQIDIWNNGDGWANGAYTSSSGDNYISGWGQEVHSPIGQLSIPIPQGATKVKVTAIKANTDPTQPITLLSAYSSWLDNNYHRYGSDYPRDSYDGWLDLDPDAKYINFGIRWSPNSSNGIRPSNIGSVTLEWDNIQTLSTTKQINVLYGDGLTVNQDNELEVNLGTGLSFNQDGEIEADQYTLPAATSNTLGGVKIGEGINVAADGTISTNAAPSFDLGKGLEYAYDDIDALPTGYGHVDYVCSNPETVDAARGRAYTAISYRPNLNTKIVCRFKRDGASTDNCVWGFREGNGNNQFVLWHDSHGSTEAESAFIYNGYSYESPWIVYPPYILHDFTFIEVDVAGDLVIDGTVYKEYTFSNNVTSDGLGIFRLKNLGNNWEYGAMNGKIYSLRIYENGTLVSNLVPAVRLADDVVGFYDNIEEQFYTSVSEYPFTTDMSTLVIDPETCTLNAKIGDRLHFDENNAIAADPYYAGEGISIDAVSNLLPSGYTRVKAISSTLNGAQYIDTGYKINADTIIDMQCTFYKRNTRVWAIPLGTRNTHNYADDGLLFVTTWDQSEVDTPSLWIAREQTNAPSDKINSFYNDIVDIHIDYHSLTCTNQRTGDVTTLTSSATIPSADYNLYVFATNDTGGVNFYGVMDLYSMTIKESNRLIHRFIPCKRNSDNKYGLYDTVDQVFKLSPNDALFTYVAGTPSSDDDTIIEKISLLPPTSNTIGGVKAGTNITIDPDGTINSTGGGSSYTAGDGINIDQNDEISVKIGDGMTVDSDGYISAKVYEAGQGITFDEAVPKGQFKVRNLEYYFDEQISWKIDGSYGPRTYTRLPGNEQCLVAIVQTTSGGSIWTTPVCLGLTETSCKYSNSYDSHIIGPDATFNYKGYTWYMGMNYGLLNSTGVDLLGNVPGPINLTSIDTGNLQNLDLVGKAIIDLAGLVVYEESIDVWGDGTGWLNGDYNDGQSDQFWTNWYYTYHYPYTSYIDVPAGAIKMRLIGISTENNSRFQAGYIDCFNSSHHHFDSIQSISATDEWVDIPENTVYVQCGVKWNDQNNRTISSTDIQSVHLEFYYNTPRNDVINAKLGNGLEFDSNDAIKAKLGSGLGFDANGAIEVSSIGDSITEGDGIEITTDSQTGVKTIAVNVGAGLEIDPNTGALGVAPGVSSNYSAGEAIEFETVSETHDIVLDLMQVSNDWVNKAYTAHIGGSFTNDSLCVHSNVTPISNLFSIPQTGAVYTVEARDQNDNLLYCLVDYHDAAGNHLNWNGEFISDPTKEYTSLSSAIYISVGVTNTDLSTALPVANVKSVTLTWKNVTETSTEISVKYGTGLSVDPITNELFVDGQLPEGTIIKKMTYVGDGTSSISIPFDKKPLGILALYGAGAGSSTPKIFAVPSPIDAPILNGAWGLSSSPNRGGIVSCTMSYNDATNELTFSNGVDPGARYNMSGETYQMFYLTKGHTGGGTSTTNEVTVIKLLSYTGTGNSTNNIQFPETPEYILDIYGQDGIDGDMYVLPFEINHPTPASQYLYMYTTNNQQHGDVPHNLTEGGNGSYSFNSTTNVLTLTGIDQGAACNYLDRVYYVRYAVNETIPSVMPYDAGEAISIEMIGGLQLTNYSNNDFVDSIASMNAGTIVKAADNSSFTLTATADDCYTRGVSAQSNGSYPYNVKASTKYRFAWDSVDPTVHGKVYIFENGSYDAGLMHEVDQYDTSYIEFTTSANTTFFQARFGVSYNGDSITYSNVRLYEVIDESDRYNEISVKHGNGLTVNGRNELEVNYGNGLEIISNAQYRPEYYFNTQVQCQVHTDNYYQLPRSFTRTYQKTTTDPALCCIWEVYDSSAYWTGPLLVGTTATSVQYTTADTQQTVTYQNTFQYLGQTWYTSGYPDFINAADHEDKLGYLQYLGSYASVSDQIQAAKDLINLALVNAGSLQAKLGSGLSFDANGAIQVTGGGGGGDTVAQGDGISITTDAQTGNKVIAVNAGSGLQINQTTHELEATGVSSISATPNTPGSITITNGSTSTPLSVISQMGGAGSSTAGSAGYVPAPASGDNDAYLRGDGVWDDDVLTENDNFTITFVPDDYQPT